MGWAYAIQNRLQHYSDKLKPQFGYRWMATFVLECVYAIQLYLHGSLLVFFFLGAILAALWILLGRMLQALVILFACYVIFRVDPPFSSDAPPIRPLVPEFRLCLIELSIFMEIMDFECCVNAVLCVALPMTFIPELNIDIILPWIKLFEECMDKCKYLSLRCGDKIQEYIGQ
ncbi:hypothetical protein CASFOL_020201 [Castilleja foliolosa]|uniref:Uncharacterized protein n=1 Tax=Castilleja foliolosa TaxID=1961234 RepID=A0ABD3D1G9_9LAMI